MKRIFFCLVLITALVFSGCNASQTQIPADWETNWTVVAPLLAVEPFDGFSLNESNDALYASGIYYATWVTGEAREHINEDGETADIFDGQIYVLVQEFRNSDSAKSNMGKWIAREKQNYETGEEAVLSSESQEFTLFSLNSGSQSNPYSSGMAAFALRGNWAICVEFLCADGYETDMQKTLEAFLSGFHYSE